MDRAEFWKIVLARWDAADRMSKRAARQVREALLLLRDGEPGVSSLPSDNSEASGYVEDLSVAWFRRSEITRLLGGESAKYFVRPEKPFVDRTTRFVNKVANVGGNEHSPYLVLAISDEDTKREALWIALTDESDIAALPLTERAARLRTRIRRAAPPQATAWSTVANITEDLRGAAHETFAAVAQRVLKHRGIGVSTELHLLTERNGKQLVWYARTLTIDAVFAAAANVRVHQANELFIVVNEEFATARDRVASVADITTPVTIVDRDVVAAYLAHDPITWSELLGGNRSFAVTTGEKALPLLLPLQPNVDEDIRRALQLFVQATSNEAAARECRELLAAILNRIGHPEPFLLLHSILPPGWPTIESNRDATLQHWVEKFQTKLEKAVAEWTARPTEIVPREEIDELHLLAHENVCVFGRHECGKTTAIHLLTAHRWRTSTMIIGRHGHPIREEDLDLVRKITEHLARKHGVIIVAETTATEAEEGSRTLQALLRLQSRFGNVRLVTAIEDIADPALAWVRTRFRMVDLNGPSRAFHARVLDSVLREQGCAMDEADRQRALDYAVRFRHTVSETTLFRRTGRESLLALDAEPWRTRRARLSTGARAIVDVLATLRRLLVEVLPEPAIRELAPRVAPHAFNDMTFDDAMKELRDGGWLTNEAGEIFFPPLVANIFAPTTDGVRDQATEFTRRLRQVVEEHQASLPPSVRSILNLVDLDWLTMDWRSVSDARNP